ncbi:expressed unknown protein [Seminavis robusta]|uniref:Uncharacterized protein n=1 Tax=Seminavis robusta TaxID=568900 RepID=A0A9N8DEG7_9STRA|nr:expressed unknown protein [Seminavis robusta]|eukprot:Sro118_g057600.1 n/a (367) ;mRNA; r:12027-13127
MALLLPLDQQQQQQQQQPPQEEEETLESVAERLRNNEGGCSCLNVRMNPGYEAADVMLLVDAVRANESLEQVEFFGILADDDVNQATQLLVESFGTLPKLKLLQVSGHCDNLMGVLSRVLADVSLTLQQLSLVYVQLSGPPNDFHSFYRSLAALQKLESFRLVDCQFPRHLQDVGILETILHRLAHLPVPLLHTLEVAPIHEKALGDVISMTTAFTQLLARQSTTLRHLHVYGFFRGQEIVVPLCQALASCHAIQNVRLASTFSQDHCTAIATLMEQHPTLQKLHLDMMVAPETNGDTTQLRLLALALQHNNTRLTHLNIYATNLVRSLLADEFGTALQHYNYSLQHLHLFGCGLSVESFPCHCKD